MIQNCTPEHVAVDSNSHFKCTTLTKRQVIYILLVPVAGMCTGATGIACAIVQYRRGFISQTSSVSLIVAGVVVIIFNTLLAISSILYKRNKVLRRSLDIEKVRTTLTLIEQDRPKKWNKNENVKRAPDATILPDYKLDSHCGLLLDKPSTLRENEAFQEHKTSVFIESKISGLVPPLNVKDSVSCVFIENDNV